MTETQTQLTEQDINRLLAVSKAVDAIRNAPTNEVCYVGDVAGANAQVLMPAHYYEALVAAAEGGGE